MKKTIRLIFLLFVLVNKTFSQPPPPPPGNYPYLENFENYSGFGGDIIGWTGSTFTLLAYSNHGTDSSIGMARQVFHSSSVSSPATINIISPVISFLTSTSVLRFDYRIVDSSLYPSTPGVMPNDASIIVSIGNEPNFTTIHTISANNHTASTDFTPLVIPLIGYNNAEISIKFEINRGTNCDYWIDFDNFRLNDAGATTTNSLKNDDMFVFSNQNGINLSQNTFFEPNTTLTVLDIQGKVVNTFLVNEINFSTGSLNLSKGVYFARVQTNKNTITKKIFIY
jgi:hypothetical protein